MRDVSAAELEDLERRDGTKSKKQQSFDEKMGGELDWMIICKMEQIYFLFRLWLLT